MCVEHTEDQGEDFGSEQLRSIVMKPVTANLQDISSSADNLDTCDEGEFSDDDLALELH
jgi:hypothetical protein